jgi:hypothetical protein
MKAYIAASILVLSFGTAFSLFWFELGFSGAQYILLFKDAFIMAGALLVIAIWALDWRGKIQVDTFDLAIATIFLVNAVLFFTSPFPATIKLTNFRKDTSLFLLFWVFYHLPIQPLIVNYIKRWTYAAFALISAFGVIEYFLPDSFWNSVINIPEYWRRNNLIAFPMNSVTESGRFYTWDYLFLWPEPIRRVVSFYTEPTTLAAFVIFVLCLSLFDLPWLACVFIGAFGCLTISKFFFLSLITIGILYRIRFRLPKHLMMFSYTFFVTIAFIGVLLNFTEGTFSHLNGVANLSELFTQKKIFGFGLGGAGNFVDDPSVAGDIGEESGLGNITAQIGVGILGYLLFFNLVFTALRKQWIASSDPRYLAGIMMWITWILSFFLSASSLGTSGNAFIFMYIGCLLSIRRSSDAVLLREEVGN